MSRKNSPFAGKSFLTSQPRPSFEPATNLRHRPLPVAVMRQQAGINAALFIDAHNHRATLSQSRNFS